MAAGNETKTSGASRDADPLVRLQAQPPARLAQAVLNGLLRVFGELRPVHRLQPPVAKAGAFTLDVLLHQSRLRIDQLSHVSHGQPPLRAGPRPDTFPIKPARRLSCP